MGLYFSFKYIVFFIIIINISINNQYSLVKKKTLTNKNYHSSSFSHMSNFLFKNINLQFGAGITYIHDLRSIRKIYQLNKQNNILRKYFISKYSKFNNYQINSYYSPYLLDKDFEKMLNSNIDTKQSYYDESTQNYYIYFKPLSKKLEIEDINGQLIRRDRVSSVYYRQNQGMKEEIRTSDDNSEKKKILDLGYNNLFNNFFKGEMLENNQFLIKLPNHNYIWHGGLFFWGSNGEIKYNTGEDPNILITYTKDYPQYFKNGKEPVMFNYDNVNDWYQDLQKLINFQLFTSIGTINQDGAIVIHRDTIKELSDPEFDFNKKWYGTGKNRTIINNNPEFQRCFNLKFKTKAFGYIEKENSFYDINPQASEVLSAVNKTFIQFPNIVFLISGDSAITLKNKCLGFDFLFNINILNKINTEKFLGMEINKIFTYSIGLILRFLLTSIQNLNMNIWSGIMFEISPNILINNKRKVINNKSIEKFIENYTEHNNFAPNKLMNFIDKKTNFFNIYLSFIFELNKIKFFISIEFVDLFMGILNVRILMTVNKTIWQNSKKYLEEIILETREIEEEEYLKKLHYN